MAVRYHPLVREALARHGVRPTPSTRPEIVHEYVNHLYRYELRRLRRRLVRGEVAKPDYASLVVDLRRKYMLVSVPLRQWTVREP
ncbi:MAG: hypothetical protein OXF93_20455 [Acidobacteria bacterium]|nr:hypothetical protein [Acidobacteriota bacterium]